MLNDPNALVVAGLTYQLLGPSAVYLGGETKLLAEKAVGNLKRIAERAVQIAGERINEPASVSPRVLRQIVNEGAWCENDLAVEYFAGLLAASRIGEDDRALPLLKLVSELSAPQIRLHYVGYSSANAALQTSKLQERLDYGTCGIYIKEREVLGAMNDCSGNILEHAISGVRRHDLFGASSAVTKHPMREDYRVFFFEPTYFGTAL